jgi:hypothetical protein
MQKKSSFKRYLELFRFLDWKAYVGLLCNMYMAFYAIFLVQLTANVIATIENSDTQRLRFLVWRFIGLTILRYVIDRLSNVLFDIEVQDMSKRMYQEFSQLYVSMDMTETDKF